MRKYTLDYDGLLTRMENIVKKRVKFYKSDFYDYDKKKIFSFAADYYVNQFERDHIRGFIWIVRECGTFLLNANADGSPYNDAAAEMLQAVRDNFRDRDNHHEYDIQFKGGNTWTISKTL